MICAAEKAHFLCEALDWGGRGCGGGYCVVIESQESTRNRQAEVVDEMVATQSRCCTFCYCA
jgi:hypothetical protein